MELLGVDIDTVSMVSEQYKPRNIDDLEVII